MKKHSLLSSLFLIIVCFSLSSQADNRDNIGQKGFQLKLSCHVYDNEVPLPACIDTERTIKVITSNGTEGYSGFELFQNNGVITVPKHFQFAVINSKDGALVLKLKVYDIASGDLVHQDMAGSYDVVRASF